MLTENIKLTIICVLVSYCIMAIVANQQHHHRHQHRHYENETESQELRRSGRYECSEQPEDIQRVRNHWEQWEALCNCPNMTAPVCGSDGVTYHNRCHLLCTSFNQYQRFRNDRIRLIAFSPCPDESVLNRNNTEPPLFREETENRS